MLNPIKVLIVDRSPEWQSRIQAIISTDPGIKVVGSASLPGDALELAADLQPDIVLLDFGIHDSLQFADVMIHKAVRSTVIMMGAEDIKALARRAFLAGAAWFVAKPEMDKSLTSEIKRMYTEYTYPFLAPLIEPEPAPDGQSLAHLTLIGQPWTGWTPDQPPPEEETVEVTHIGQQIILFDGPSERYLLQIIGVKAGKLAIYVSGLGVKQGEGRKRRGINLSAASRSEITMVPGETVELYTFSMDAGKSWEVTLRRL